MFNVSTFWIAFICIAAIIIILDLNFTGRTIVKPGIKRSLIWSGVWISAALLFNISIYFFAEQGHQKGLEFITGYLVEYSLSIDNLFIFLLIFNVMNVPGNSQPHVLKWGILTAIVFRIVFIIAGVGLMNLFHPVIYLFCIILFFASYKMAFGKEQKIDYKNNLLIKFIRRYYNIQPDYTGIKFFVKDNKKVFVTTLFLTFLLIESFDIIFAIDSIPAVIAITRDPFVIITSNIFAILGLRSLYFALSGLVNAFYFLKYGVAVILFFVGAKMLLSEVLTINTELSLGIILFCLLASIILSLWRKQTS
ncbi:MAG: TerC/Alx family metal homeostasis membrane protein [Ignavibacteriaceae bacterium]